MNRPVLHLPTRVPVGLLAVLLIGLVPAAWSQTRKPATATDHLAALKPGQWIQLEGRVRPDAPVLCTEVRQLAGDFLDDDWSIQGAVQLVDVVRNEFVVGGCHIQVGASTLYDDPGHRIKSLPDLRVGMLVDVEGTFLSSRMLLAAEVDDESDEMVHRPALKDQLEIVGRIEKVDTRQRIVTVMGLTFQVTDKTKLRSAIQ